MRSAAAICHTVCVITLVVMEFVRCPMHRADDDVRRDRGCDDRDAWGVGHRQRRAEALSTCLPCCEPNGTRNSTHIRFRTLALSAGGELALAPIHGGARRRSSHGQLRSGVGTNDAPYHAACCEESRRIAASSPVHNSPPTIDAPTPVHCEDGCAPLCSGGNVFTLDFLGHAELGQRELGTESEKRVSGFTAESVQRRYGYRPGHLQHPCVYQG